MIQLGSTYRATPPASDRVSIVVSIDTEEDEWAPTSRSRTAANVAELRGLSQFFRRLGVRPTYFVTYRVAADREAATTLREISAKGDCEIGAHLHPWNTPPYCGIEDAQSMLGLYPAQAQRAKIGRLMGALEANLGRRPRCFRAGRFGIGRETVSALLDAGLTVDSSVTPLTNWRAYGGPSFLEAPNAVYRVDRNGDVCHPCRAGPLVEVPITVGYSGMQARRWHALAGWLDYPHARRLKIPGLMSRLAGIRRVVLSPERESGAELARFGRRMVSEGMRYLHMYFHSNSLVPGLTPFTPTAAHVRALYDSIEQFLDAVAQLTDVSFCTVSEAAELLEARNVEHSGLPLSDGMPPRVAVG